jgi:alpha-2-macroglobulin
MTATTQRLRTFGAVGLATALAACFHLSPPSVTPSGTLGPSDGRSGPRTTGELGIAFAGPHGVIADRSEAAVTILFTRPMRALEDDEHTNLPALEVRTRDGRSISGSLRWVGTRGLLFQPDSPLPGGTEFVATVPSGVRSVDGQTLQNPFELSFESAPLRVENVGASGTILGADGRIPVVFNQAVDPAVVARSVRLLVRGKESDPGIAVPVSVRAVKGAYENRNVEIVPEKPLPLDSSVELTIVKGLVGADGPAALGESFLWKARTFGPLRLVDFRCPRVTPQGPCASRNDIRVTLSTPVMPDELARHVVLPKDLRGKPSKDKRARVEKASTQHYVGADPKAGKRYTITLKAGMRDIFGQKLEKDEKFDVVVEAPFVGRKVGGKAPATTRSPARPDQPDAEQGPHRARLDHRLELGLRGSLVEAAATTGQKTHRIPVGSVNLPTYGRLAVPLDEVQTVSYLGGGLTADFLAKNRLVTTLVTPQAQPNVRAVETLDLDGLLGGAGKGRGNILTLLEVPGEGTAIKRLLKVTDLGISAKASRWGTLVWVTHLSTGKPAANARVTVRSGTKGELWQGVTDGDGVALVPASSVPLYDPKTNAPIPSVVIVRDGDDWTHLELERASTDRRVAGSYQDFSARSEWVGLVYTDRGVYRPGEKIKAAGLVRGMDASGLRTVAGKDVRLSLTDERGTVIATASTATDKFGSYAADLPIPRAAHLGDAQLTATVRDHGSVTESSTTLRFLAFKASEFKVAVEPAAASLVRGEEASFSVHGEFLFGAPMADAKVRTVLRRSETSYTVPNTAGFFTSDSTARDDSSEDAMRAAELGEANDQLDQEGRFERKARLSLPGQRGPERVTLEAEVEDLSRQTVANRSSVLVHPAAIYVGVRLPGDRFVNAGALLVPEVIATTPKGERQVGVPIKLELIKRHWTTAVEDQPSGVPARTSRRVDEVVASCTTTSAKDPKGCELRVGEGASYFVRASAADAQGHEAKASVAFYGIDSSSAAKAGSGAWEARDDGQLRLELNKAVFQPGETAKVLVQNPFREAEALVTVERNGVLTRKVVALNGPMPVVELPVDDSYYPNAYISVHAVRGRIQAPPAEGTDLGGPEFRAGYTELKLDPEARRLKVALDPGKKEFRPGEEVDTAITITDRNGKPVESAFTFYAVDEGVLMLTSYKTPDPLPPFTRRRPLSLFTAENREDLASLLPLRAGERIPILGWEYEVARAGYDKGESGGDGGEGGANPLRADFRTTAFFEAGRVTDGEGKAHVKMKLPDNLTTFRLMAVAAGGRDHFGSGEADILTNRKLMARPALPRTIRVGDELSASVIVSSKESVGGAVSVTLKASGIGMLGEKTQTASIVPGKSVEVRFPVKATAPGTATFEFEVDASGERDRVRVTREVQLPVVLDRVAAFGETDSAEAVTLTNMDKMRSDRGDLEIHVAPSALVGVSQGVDDLLQYPYGCAEQLTSRMLPLLALHDAAKDFGLPANGKDIVDQAIPKVLAAQNGDGSFGFWDDSRSGSPWLTAYVVLALENAKKQGHYVPADALGEAVNYLQELERQTSAASVGSDDDAEPEADKSAKVPDDPTQRTPEQKATITWSETAFASDVLATIGRGNPGTLTHLFESRKGKPLFARAMLLHGMAKGGALSTQVEELAKELESELTISASQAVATETPPAYLDDFLDSPARRTALVLRGLVATNAAHPLAPRLARGVLSLRQDGGWSSTQDTAWSLLALGDYRVAQESAGNDVEARVFLGDENLLRQNFRGTADREVTVKVSADRVVKAGGQALSFEAVGTGRVYWSAVLTNAPKELPKTARDEGLYVQKLLRTVAPKDLSAAVSWIPKRTQDAVTAGDLILVDLLLESSEHQKQVVVDDPLPAGLEALDARLDTTADIQAVTDDDGSTPRHAGSRGTRVEAEGAPATAMTGLNGAFQKAFVHREIHDDRVLTFIEDLPPGLYHFRYLARATSVGRFVVPPTHAEAMYRADVSGRSAGSYLDVRAKP